MLLDNNVIMHYNTKALALQNHKHLLANRYNVSITLSITYRQMCMLYKALFMFF